MAEPARRDLRHFGGTIRRAQLEAGSQHFDRMMAPAAAEFENRPTLWQRREKISQPDGGCFRPFRKGLGVTAVELQCGLIPSTHSLLEHRVTRITRSSWC